MRGSFASILAEKLVQPINVELPRVKNEFLKKTVLSLVIPTYNESKNIPELIEKIEKLLINVNFEIIIVDDSSPDGTAAIAADLNAKYGNIKVCKRLGKLGLSSAVLEGFHAADAEVLAVMDADMQHPPEVLSEMYRKILSGYDLVIASRYAPNGEIVQWSIRRAIMSRMATILVHVLLPKTRGIKDIMSGYFVVKRSAIARTNLDPVGFKILLEILAKVNCNQIYEIPYTFGSRKNGKSNLNSGEIKNFLIHILKLLKASSRTKNFNVEPPMCY